MVWQLKITFILKFVEIQNLSFSGSFRGRCSNFCVSEMLGTFLKWESSLLFGNSISFYFISVLFRKRMGVRF